MQDDIRHIMKSLFAGFVLIIGFGVGLYAWDARLADMNGAIGVSSISPASGDEAAATDIEIGAAYDLIDQDGQPVTQDSYPGKYKMVFFGFTNCPDICPTELQKMAIVMKTLGDDAGKIQPIFITTDPARDTPDVMKNYIAQFYPGLAGLTGSEEQVKQAADSFRVFSEKAAHESGGEHYLMNHSAFTYFMGPDNTLITVFSASDNPEHIRQEIKKALIQG